jgi:hypothetical protein
MSKPDTYSREFAPPWAVTAWADDRSVYIELPAKAGPPVVLAFSLTEGGLGKALALMRSCHAEVKCATAATRPRSRPGQFSEGQLTVASTILRKLGMA